MLILLPIVLLLGGIISEALAYLTIKSTKVREWFSWSGILFTMATAILIASIWLTVFSLVLLLISWFRALNLFRIIERRMDINRLRHAAPRTGLWLLLGQTTVMLIWLGWDYLHSSHAQIWAVLAAFLALSGLLLLLSTIRGLVKTRWPKDHYHYPDYELPSVSVLVPARNESKELEECLRSIIASDYPKLEVLVLDDSSQTRDTPEIIKSFAQDGVRFVQGDEPQAGWLAKNQAYAKLAAAASGDYLLFCGVDVRLSPNSIRHALSVMMDRQKKMLSILPLRHDETIIRTSLVQAARYMWEISLPRRFFNRPPVLSTCWLIASESLKKSGSFAAVRRAIVPEGYFAKKLIVSDGYSFLRSDTTLDIRSTKDLGEQKRTAVRMRYPQMHHRPEQTLFISLLEVVFLLLPLFMTGVGFIIELPLLAHILFGIAALSVLFSYELVAIATRVSSRLFGFLAQPLAVMTDLRLLYESMLAYEFGRVYWKGREISTAVMRSQKEPHTNAKPAVGKH